MGAPEVIFRVRLTRSFTVKMYALVISITIELVCKKLLSVFLKVCPSWY